MSVVDEAGWWWAGLLIWSGGEHPEGLLADLVWCMRMAFLEGL